jgi:AhpD family alkylhydroperoxidase
MSKDRRQETVMTSNTRVPRAEKCDRLDANLASFAAMAAAATIGCLFCLDFHYFTAHNKRLDQTKAREVPRRRQSAVFTPLERRVMEYAEACGLRPLATRANLVGSTR